MTETEIGTRAIEAAIAVHRELGPGLLGTVPAVVLAREPETDRLQARLPAGARGGGDEDQNHPLREWF